MIKRLPIRDLEKFVLVTGFAPWGACFIEFARIRRQRTHAPAPPPPVPPPVSPENLCQVCLEHPRHKLDLLCRRCRVQSSGRTGLAIAACRCECGYTCGRKCGLDLEACIAAHWREDCAHRWDGPFKHFTSPAGGGGGTATCSQCGEYAIDHDCAVGP